MPSIGWSADDIQGLRYHAQEAAREGMAALAAAAPFRRRSMSEQEQAIRERLAKITPGPWSWESVAESGHAHFADADFITHAPDDLSYLLAALAAERAAREQAEQRVARLRAPACLKCGEPMEWREQVEFVDGGLALTMDRMSDLLTRTANGLKGKPPDLTSWSWHDLPEIAEKLRTSAEEMKDIIGSNVDSCGSTAAEACQRAEEALWGWR